MTSFEAGFLKYARECGLSNNQTTHILKRAMDYPGAKSMFHQLPTDETQDTPEDLEALKELLKQELIYRQMQGQTKTIQMQ